MFQSDLREYFVRKDSKSNFGPSDWRVGWGGTLCLVQKHITLIVELINLLTFIPTFYCRLHEFIDSYSNSKDKNNGRFQNFNFLDQTEKCSVDHESTSLINIFVMLLIKRTIFGCIIHKSLKFWQLRERKIENDIFFFTSISCQPFNDCV